MMIIAVPASLKGTCSQLRTACFFGERNERPSYVKANARAVPNKTTNTMAAQPHVAELPEIPHKGAPISTMSIPLVSLHILQSFFMLCI